MVKASEKGEEPAAATMLGEGSASAQQQPVEPDGASAATASQAEAACKAASLKELPPANVEEGASSHLTETPSAGMSKNQMKKLAKQQRSVHFKAWMPPVCYSVLLFTAMPEAEHLRLFGHCCLSPCSSCIRGWPCAASVAPFQTSDRRTLSNGHWSLLRGLHHMHRGLAAICRYAEGHTVKQALWKLVSCSLQPLTEPLLAESSHALQAQTFTL